MKKFHGAVRNFVLPNILLDAAMRFTFCCKSSLTESLLRLLQVCLDNKNYFVLLVDQKNDKEREQLKSKGTRNSKNKLLIGLRIKLKACFEITFGLLMIIS